MPWRTWAQHECIRLHAQMTNLSFVGIPAIPRQVWYIEGLSGSSHSDAYEVQR